jgi:hypothetical protein
LLARPRSPRRIPLNNLTNPDERCNPVLSVVVIPLIGRDVLAACIDRLPLSKVECIVVLRRAMGTAASWQQRYQSVTFLDATNEPVPMRRQIGVAAATGDIVGLIEDTSWPDETWYAAAREAFEDPQVAAAGGSVRIAATLPSRYQALGWSEYGAFAPIHCAQTSSYNSEAKRPWTAGRVPGNNMVFRSVDLIEAMHGEVKGLFEGAVCERMLARGRRVVFQPQMSVTFSASDPHNASLATRLHHGRIYSAGQVANRTWPGRLAHLTKTPLLPLVLTIRRASFLARSGRMIARLPVLFWIFLMESSWALGEAVGTLRGVGKSMSEWR